MDVKKPLEGCCEKCLVACQFWGKNAIFNNGNWTISQCLVLGFPVPLKMYMLYSGFSVIQSANLPAWINCVRVHFPEVWDPAYPKILVHWHSSMHTETGRPVLWRAGPSIETRSQGLPSLDVDWKLLFQSSRVFGPGFCHQQRAPRLRSFNFLFWRNNMHLTAVSLI